MHISSVQCIQYTIVQYNGVQFSLVEFSAVQCSGLSSCVNNCPSSPGRSWSSRHRKHSFLTHFSLISYSFLTHFLLISHSFLTYFSLISYLFLLLSVQLWKMFAFNDLTAMFSANQGISFGQRIGNKSLCQ